MKTSGQNHLKIFIVTFLMCIIQAKGAVLSITTNQEYSRTTQNASLTCTISPFTHGAEWIKNKSSLTQCLSGLCIPPFSTRYQYSANATSITVTIPSPDVAQDETTWTCAHNSGADVANYNLTVFSTPSANLSITGPTSSAINDNVTVHLSVITGCIHPSGPGYYNVMWKYVEAGLTAEKLFETGITQNVISVGGCANAYEDSLMINLYLTNKMNTRITTLSITQVKMIFTMAGISSPASLNVAYNVTGTGTTSTSPSTNNQLALGLGLGIGLGVPGVTGIIIAIVMLVKKFNTDEAIPPKPTGQNNKTKDTGSSFTVSREHVEVQMDQIGVKGDDEERFPAVHTGPQNKVEPKTSSKHSNDRHQPMPPQDTGFENTSKIRPQPPPPQNSDIKDQNLRGISANFDDTRGLANETPRPNKLPPLEDVSEETKKKRKKKKKKGQRNDGNPEEGMVQLKSTRTWPVPGDQSDGD